jgi:hypothetical protein
VKTALHMSKSSRPVRRCLRKLECESRGEVRLDCRFKEGALQQAATTRPPRLTIRIRYFTLSCTSLSIHAVALLDNPHMHVRHMLIYFYFSHTMKPLVTSPRRTLHSHSLGTCRSGQRSRRSNTRITIKEQPLFFLAFTTATAINLLTGECGDMVPAIRCCQNTFAIPRCSLCAWPKKRSDSITADSRPLVSHPQQGFLVVSR